MDAAPAPGGAGDVDIKVAVMAMRITVPLRVPHRRLHLPPGSLATNAARRDL
jgi:hypothetical protein